MRELDGLHNELYAVRLYRVLWELDTLPPSFYYELFDNTKDHIGNAYNIVSNFT